MANKISEKDLDALSLVMDRFNRSEGFSKAWHDNGEKWYKRYRFYKSPGKYAYKHNVKDRLTFTIVEVITARVLQAMFAVSPFISVVPREGDDVRMSKQLEKVLDTLMANPDTEFFLEFTDFVKQAVIYGTSYLSIVPKFNTSTWQFEGFAFNCEDFMDIFPDPAAKRLSNAKFVIKRSVRYWDELKELEKLGVYKNVDHIKSDTVADFDHKVKDRLMSIGLNTGVDYADPKTGEVEVLEYYAEGEIITVGARKVILRNTKEDVQKRATMDFTGKASAMKSVLPYDLPIVDMRFIPVPREFFGIGAPEVLEEDQHYIDTLRSQRLDNLDLIINKLFKVKIHSDVDPDMIFSGPGNIIPVTNLDDIEEFRVSDVTGSSYQEQEQVMARAEDAIGEQGRARGEPPVRRETATTTVRLQEAGMTRFDTVLKIIEFTAVRALGKKGIQLIHEYMNPQQFARIVNPKDEFEEGAIEQFFSLPQDELLHQLDVVPVGSSITSQREVRTQQIIQAQNLLMQMQQMGQMNQPPFNVNLMEVAKLVLDDLDIKNINDLIQELPPQQPMMPEQAGMEQAGLEGGGPPPTGGLPPMPPPTPEMLSGAAMAGGGQGGFAF